MESELEKFRRRKQLEEKKAELKAKIKRTTDSWTRSLCEALLPKWNDEENKEQEDEDEDEEQSGTSTSSPTPVNPKAKWLMYSVILLRFLTWLFVFMAFVKIGFGAVFFTISSLVFIYWNTRKSRRRKGEVSAYSVFNKDCQSIDGTLKAEHLEKQLLYRSQ